MDIYAERIKPLFDASGMNNAEIEAALGLSGGTLYKWNRAGYKSYVSHVGEIARYFGVSADYLLGLVDEKEKRLPVPQNENEAALLEKLGQINLEDFPRLVAVLEGLLTDPEKTRPVLDLLPKVL